MTLSKEILAQLDRLANDLEETLEAEIIAQMVSMSDDELAMRIQSLGVDPSILREKIRQRIFGGTLTQDTSIRQASRLKNRSAKRFLIDYEMNWQPIPVGVSFSADDKASNTHAPSEIGQRPFVLLDEVHFEPIDPGDYLDGAGQVRPESGTFPLDIFFDARILQTELAWIKRLEVLRVPEGETAYAKFVFRVWRSKHVDSRRSKALRIEVHRGDSCRSCILSYRHTSHPLVFGADVEGPIQFFAELAD